MSLVPTLWVNVGLNLTLAALAYSSPLSKTRPQSYPSLAQGAPRRTTGQTDKLLPAHRAPSHPGQAHPEVRCGIRRLAGLACLSV